MNPTHEGPPGTSRRVDHNGSVPTPADPDPAAPGPSTVIGTPDTVRAATMADVDRIGAITADAWRDRLRDILPAHVLESLRPPDLALVWAGALINPPTPAHRLLVAIGSGDIAGYAAVGPSTDPDADAATGELLALEVDPRLQRCGHGSRLMSAAVDLGRSAGYDTLSTWCPVHDEIRRAFLQSAGWAPDTAVRDLAMQDPQSADRTLREARLVTDIRGA